MAYEALDHQEGQGHRRLAVLQKSFAQPSDQPHLFGSGLAIRLDSLLDSGLVANQTEIAKTVGITMARITQILNLTYLAPDIQQTILELEPTKEKRDPLLERDARTIATNLCWTRQRKEFASLTKRCKIECRMGS